MGSGCYQLPSAPSVPWLHLRWELPTLDFPTKHLFLLQLVSASCPLTVESLTFSFLGGAGVELPISSALQLFLSRTVIITTDKHHSGSYFYFIKMQNLAKKNKDGHRKQTDCRAKTGVVFFLEGPMQVPSENMVRSSRKIKPGINNITDKPRRSSRMCVEEYIQRVMQFLLTVCSCCLFS